jgi:hypothetical protein
MLSVSKKIVTDEAGTPVAVQIDYEDWKEIEKVLQKQPSAPADEDDGFEQALAASRNTWTAGDGLEYQRRIRSEWENRSRSEKDTTQNDS